MKKGDVITLKSGRDFELPFKPVKASGQGAGRTWKGVTDDHWRSLYDALADYKSVERNEVCKHYGCSYQKLLKMFQSSVPVKSVAGSTPLARIDVINSKISKHENAIAELRAELSGLKEDAKQELMLQMAELDKL